MKIDFLQAELNFVYRQLLDADTVAKKRGDKYGLCDEIDNSGRPYQSQAMFDLLNRALQHVTTEDRVSVVKLSCMTRR